MGVTIRLDICEREEIKTMKCPKCGVDNSSIINETTTLCIFLDLKSYLV